MNDYQKEIQKICDEIVRRENGKDAPVTYFDLSDDEQWRIAGDAEVEYIKRLQDKADKKIERLEKENDKSSSAFYKKFLEWLSLTRLISGITKNGKEKSN
jgi:hypothetical protein